ncbi:phosphoglycolate phosphatase, partial [gut metagenome]
MAKYDAVLFDVDGTLLHSSPGIIESMEFTFRQMGVNPSRIDLTRYLGPPLRKSFGEHFKDEASIEKMVQLYREEYKRTGQHLCTPYKGAKELLQTLKDAG